MSTTGRSKASGSKDKLKDFEIFRLFRHKTTHHSPNSFYPVSKFLHLRQKTFMTKITVNNNGSLKIDGDFEIVDKEGNAYGLQGRTIVSLCRCGKSANKPFCDGSHKEHFEHEAIAFDLPPKKV
tara:strand:- start:132 stop:503 length:372 start_codon:yes stop_codon:yes gene_type:complete